VAVSSDGATWFLLNASPDIRQQILDTPALAPRNSQSRGSGIAAALLTNADIDHSLGLLLLREGQRLAVHAMGAVRETLTNGISIAPVLESFCGIEWIQPPLDPAPLPKADGSESGLLYQAIPLAGKPPRFASNARAKAGPDGNVVGYRILDRSTGGRFLFLPNVAEFEKHLAPLLQEADLILFDGTFWSDNEMIARGAGHQSATAMGHLPISGEAGSLERLRGLKARHKIFVHINNTNPILFEDSPERAAVERSGCSVGCDGTEIVI
jgi:pyrroloquinoline quinone biosynthesis protein B